MLNKHPWNKEALNFEGLALGLTLCCHHLFFFFLRFLFIFFRERESTSRGSRRRCHHLEMVHDCWTRYLTSSFYHGLHKLHNWSQMDGWLDPWINGWPDRWTQLRHCSTKCQNIMPQLAGKRLQQRNFVVSQGIYLHESKGKTQNEISENLSSPHISFRNVTGLWKTNQITNSSMWGRLGGSIVAQSAKRLTLDFSSGPDLRVLGSSPASDPTQRQVGGRWFCLKILPLLLPLPLLTRFLSLSLK